MKKIINMILVLILLIAVLIPVNIFADNDRPLLIDNAGLLTEAENKELANKLETISENQNMDVVIITVDSLEGKTPTAYADDFYDYNGYGYGPDKDGILFLISMADRDWCISTTGYGIAVFTDKGQEYIVEHIIKDLGNDKFYAAFDKFADYSDMFITKAREDKPYDVGNMPKEKFKASDVGISFVISAIIVYIYAKIKASKMKSIVQQLSAENYVRPNSFDMTVKTDTFINKTTTSRKIKSDSGGGGSSTHSSSSGTTHGGSSGKF